METFYVEMAISIVKSEDALAVKIKEYSWRYTNIFEVDFNVLVAKHYWYGGEIFNLARLLK
jgi:hypothetical protein